MRRFDFTVFITLLVLGFMSKDPSLATDSTEEKESEYDRGDPRRNLSPHSDEEKDLEAQAQAYFNSAKKCNDLRQFEKAVELYEIGAHIIEATRALDQVHSVALGYAYYSLGEYTQAFKKYLYALQTSECYTGGGDLCISLEDRRKKRLSECEPSLVDYVYATLSSLKTGKEEDASTFRSLLHKRLVNNSLLAHGMPPQQPLDYFNIAYLFTLFEDKENAAKNFSKYKEGINNELTYFHEAYQLMESEASEKIKSKESKRANNLKRKRQRQGSEEDSQEKRQGSPYKKHKDLATDSTEEKESETDHAQPAVNINTIPLTEEKDNGEKKNTQVSCLTYSEKKVFEELFGMSNGVPLDFTNRTFKEFFLEFNIEIYTEKYSDKGESKANRLRSFWQQESDQIVGKVLQEMLLSIKDKESTSYITANEIVSRLLGNIISKISSMYS